MKFINFKKIGIILGIIIVLNLFINFGIATFYDAPDYTDFCLEGRWSQVYDTQEICEAGGGAWTANQSMIKTREITQPIVTGIQQEPAGWCDIDYTCRKQYEDAREIYQRNVFIVLVSFGVAFLVAGLVISTIGSLSVSFIYGGLLSVIIGTIRFWSEMDDYLRFIVLGIALAVLIYIAVKKFKGE